MTLSDSAKSFIPRSVRRRLRSAHRQWTLERALRQTEGVIAGHEPVDGELAGQLLYGWGNEGWSAKAGLVTYLLNDLRGFKGTMLECGSGLSTVLMAMIARRTGARIISLEHNPEWYKLMVSRLRSHGLGIEGLLLAPLADFGEFDWYDTGDALAETGQIDVVLCDGPPNSTRGGRYGLLPRMGNRFAPGCRVIVDDTQRAEEIAMIERWQQESCGQMVVERTITEFSVLRMR
jgi:hypothetical protein